MFTSRAEFRLLLRADNADQRLTEKGVALGVVGPDRAQTHAVRADALQKVRRRANELSLTPREAVQRGLAVNSDGQRRNVSQLLACPGVTLDRLSQVWPEIEGWAPMCREQIEIDALYSGYLDRQAADVAAFRRDEDLMLDPKIDYSRIGGLSNEAREKLAAVRPRTLGQAGRIEGVTPGALTALLAHVRRGASDAA
jgi:tRNA uridine 5-carboxymethylaminomethyl modification enzyme